MSSVHLQSIKSFHVGGGDRRVQGLPVFTREVAAGGGTRVLDMNGTYSVGQLYASAYRLAAARWRCPVLLWHGGGMTGAQWESTPDGRTGWLWRLLGAGFDVVVSDGPERGRASFAMASQPGAGEPVFRSREEAWDVFRIGPPGGYHPDAAQRRAFAGQQFPHEDFDGFSRQFVPRWLGHDAIALDAYEALLERVGPAIVVGHSQGGGYATQLAQRRPDLVRAVVAIEPTGVPAHCTQPVAAPHLLLWGDHFAESALWTRYRQQTEQYWGLLAQQGPGAQTLDLPTRQIRGNSHFCMADRNSDAIADLVATWLAGQGLTL